MIKNQHILIIRFSAMGDVAMTIPVIRAFARQHSTVKITVVSKGFLKPLFNDVKNVTFFVADVNGKHKGILGLYKLYQELKFLKITHIADLHNVLRSKIIRMFFRFCGIPIKFINKGRAEKKALTRVKNKIFKQLKTSHQRYVDVFEELGFSINISNPKLIEKPKLVKNVLEIFGKKTQQWIGIAPFAAFESKTYPMDLMEQVIKNLSEKTVTLFLFGGKKEVPILKYLVKKYSNTILVAGKLDGLKNEINLISNLDVMLSMDSANAHFSAMQHVKTVTLWGGTHPFAGFAPFNQPADYCMLPDLKKYPNIPCSIYGKKTCDEYKNIMRSIDPKEITKKIVEILHQK